MPDTDIASNIILVAQDGSPTAQAAASAAIQIAQSQNLMVHGLYVVDETLILDTHADIMQNWAVRMNPLLGPN